MKKGLTKETKREAEKRRREALGMIRSLKKIGVKQQAICDAIKLSWVAVYYWSTKKEAYPSEKHLRRLRKFFMGFYHKAEKKASAGRSKPKLQKAGC